MKYADLPVPELMSKLPRDRRGLPVPVIVLTDRDGQPNFSVNDDEVRTRMFREDRCSICGNKLLRGRWSAAGPGSLLHPKGAVLDPPTHYECSRYALQVCPFLAMSSYVKSVSKVAPLQTSTIDGRLTHNPTTLTARPPVWMHVMYIGQKTRYSARGSVESMRPNRPYRKIEYWSDGVELDDDVGRGLADAYVAANNEKWKSMLG